MAARRSSSLWPPFWKGERGRKADASVQDDEVGLDLGPAQGPIAVGGGGDLEAREPEGGREQIANIGLVVDHEEVGLGRRALVLITVHEDHCARAGWTFPERRVGPVTGRRGRRSDELRGIELGQRDDAHARQGAGEGVDISLKIVSAKEKGAEATLFTPDEFNPSMVGDFDSIALGCAAMGDEVLEEGEF